MASFQGIAVGDEVSIWEHDTRRDFFSMRVFRYRIEVVRVNVNSFETKDGRRWSMRTGVGCPPRSTFAVPVNEMDEEQDRTVRSLPAKERPAARLAFDEKRKATKNK